MAEQPQTAEWQPAAQCPSQRFGEPFRINCNEFAVAPSNGVGLMKYDISKNEWREWIKYPKDLRSSYHASAFDADRDILFIYNSEKTVIKIDLKTERFEVTESAFIYQDEERRNVLVQGLVRCCDGGEYIPHDLMNVMASFYCVEYLHVMSYSSSNGNHWKINVEAILNN